MSRVIVTFLTSLHDQVSSPVDILKQAPDQISSLSISRAASLNQVVASRHHSLGSGASKRSRPEELGTSESAIAVVDALDLSNGTEEELVAKPPKRGRARRDGPSPSENSVSVRVSLILISLIMIIKEFPP